MKRLILTITAVLFMTSASYAAEVFVPITGDNEVTSIDQVKIKGTVTESQHTNSIYTLPSIDSKIAKKQARIEHLQADIVELQMLRGKVETEAKKIVLKVDVPPEEPK